MPLALDQPVSLESARDQRDILAKALYAVLQKAGCLNADGVADGPVLLMAANDFSEGFTRANNSAEPILSDADLEQQISNVLDYHQAMNAFTDLGVPMGAMRGQEFYEQAGALADEIVTKIEAAMGGDMAIEAKSLLYLVVERAANLTGPQLVVTFPEEDASRAISPLPVPISPQFS